MMLMAPQASVKFATPAGPTLVTANAATQKPAQGATVFNAKSAVALVNERRIEFIRARNVRVIGKIDEATGKVLSSSSSSSSSAAKKRVLVESEDIERLLAWKHSKKIGPGFANLGNTCYLNSVLQCLSYTPSFVQYLLEKDVFASFAGGSLNNNSSSSSNNSGKFFNKNSSSSSLNKGSNGFCGVRVMCRLLQSIYGNGGGANGNGRVLQPKEFVMNIRHVSKSFRIGRQEDSHEFFRLLLDSMQRSCLRKANIKLETHPAAATTLVNRTFGGKLKNSLKCVKCNYVSERFDDFLDLSLEINNGIKSVKGALKHFTAVETLDDSNAWKCTSCKKLNRAEKSMTIETCPNVLVVQLKRFDIMFGKIKKHIEFGTTLDISSGMSKSSEDRKRGRCKYELHAVLVHAGYSTDCGHYYAFVKGSSGQWYEMNDESVRWVSLETVLQQKAYMLFYSRVLPASERPQPKAKPVVEEPKASVVAKAGAEEIPVKVATESTAVGPKAKELDMNGFLASLQTNIDGIKDAEKGDKSIATTGAQVVDAMEPESKVVALPTATRKQIVVTFNVTKRRAAATAPSKGSLAFSGHMGKLYKYRTSSWRLCSGLNMSRETTENVVISTPSQTVAVSRVHAEESSPVPTKPSLGAAAAAPTADPKPLKVTKIHFDPRQMKNIGVKSAALFGKSVDKWGETNGWADEKDENTEGGELTDEATDALLTGPSELEKELAAKHDRVMSKLKNEDWKHRNAGRQDYWDETLDAGKVKKLKKRKEFVANQGLSNKFQLKLQHKKQRHV